MCRYDRRAIIKKQRAGFHTWETAAFCAGRPDWHSVVFTGNMVAGEVFNCDELAIDIALIVRCYVWVRNKCPASAPSQVWPDIWLILKIKDS